MHAYFQFCVKEMYAISLKGPVTKIKIPNNLAPCKEFALNTGLFCHLHHLSLQT